jgi:hypothetical protein
MSSQLCIMMRNLEVAGDGTIAATVMSLVCSVVLL